MNHTIREATAQDASVMARFLPLMLEEMASMGGHDVLRSEEEWAHNRRKGVGQALLRAILDWGQRSGCVEAELNTLVRNPARSLYEKLGFSEFEIKMIRRL